MMLKNEVDELIRKIADTGGATDDMMEDLKKLSDEFDEREGELNRYREEKDTTEGKEEVREEGAELVNWKEKYDEMKNRYMDRFFNGTEEEARSRMEATKQSQDEDVTKDGELLTFNDLFKEREG